MGAVTFQPRLEVAEIFRTHGEEYRARHPISPEQAAVMRHLTACRTAVLGGHVDACDQCGFVNVSYNSCRDRHCPKCQSAQRAAWLETRLKRLLPVEYFHVVFTLPEQLQPLALKNRRLVYDLLFRAASETLLELAADPKRLAIANGRLISLEEGQVWFHYKDYADGSTWKVTSLSAEEFIRRFLLHVVPKRFARIRHYGLLAGRNVPTKLAHCQELLRDKTRPQPSSAQLKTDGVAMIDPVRLVCPHCGHPLTRYSFDGESARTGIVATRAVNDIS